MRGMRVGGDLDIKVKRDDPYGSDLKIAAEPDETGGPSPR
jgi:hypothetical protein